MKDCRRSYWILRVRVKQIRELNNLGGYMSEIIILSWCGGQNGINPMNTIAEELENNECYDLSKFTRIKQAVLILSDVFPAPFIINYVGDAIDMDDYESGDIEQLADTSALRRLMFNSSDPKFREIADEMEELALEASKFCEHIPAELTAKIEAIHYKAVEMYKEEQAENNEDFDEFCWWDDIDNLILGR